MSSALAPSWASALLETCKLQQQTFFFSMLFLGFTPYF